MVSRGVRVGIRPGTAFDYVNQQEEATAPPKTVACMRMTAYRLGSGGRSNRARNGQ